MIYVGVDPDTTGTGIAAVNEAGSVLAVHVAKACDETDECSCLPTEIAAFLKGDWRSDLPSAIYRFAVEDQEYRHERAHGSPAPLFKVAHAAGAAFAGLAYNSYCQGGEFVAPMKWKGSVPKLQHHRRLLTRLDVPYAERGSGKSAYVVPVLESILHVAGVDKVGLTNWPEVLDAIGIALWLKEKHRGR